MTEQWRKDMQAEVEQLLDDETLPRFLKVKYFVESIESQVGFEMDDMPMTVEEGIAYETA